MFVEISGLWIGHIDTHNISDVEYLSVNYPELLNSYGYALISRIDSHTALSVSMPSVRCILDEERLSVRDYDGSLLSDGRSVVELASTKGLFNGFDEVWFLNSVPNVTMPEDIEIFSDTWVTNQFDIAKDARLSSLISWMSASEAGLGISDGQGLNYVTTSGVMAQKLEDAYS